MPEKVHAGEKDLSQMALSLFEKVREIKKANPVIAKNIDTLEKEIRERLVAIKREIDKLDKRDKELVTVLVINGLHRTADEVLID
jgi:CHASE3 domain sensor protein